jgi:GT2 family glycosyltransferase
VTANPPPASSPVRLPFDRYQRYALAAHVVRALDLDPSPRVLEVGANVHGDLTRFLPAARVVQLDLATPPAAAAPARFVRGDGCRIPFRDGAFDVVLSLDVLEHVVRERRRRFVAEALRTAARCVVIAAPFHSADVEAHEAHLNAYFRDLHGMDFPWLAEHALRGLPDLAETLAAARGSGWAAAAFGAGNLGLWAKLMQVHFFVNSEPPLVPLREDVDALYNAELAGKDWAPPFYRHFVVATRDPADLARATRPFHAAGAVDDGDLLRLQDRLDRVYETGARDRARRMRDVLEAARERELAQHAERDDRVTLLEARLREQESTLVRLETAVARPRGLAALRIGARGHARRGVALVRRGAHAGVVAARAVLGLWRSRLHAMRLEPLHELVAEEGGFRSLGNDPQFRLRSSRRRPPRGWSIVSFAIDAGGQRLGPKLYVDAGRGFSESLAFALPIRGAARVECTVRLPDRVAGLRLDPLAAPGRFAIRDVAVREIGTIQLGLALLGQARAVPTLADVRRLWPRALAIVRARGFRALAHRLLEREPSHYAEWVQTYDSLTDVDRALIRRHVEALADPPLVSIVMPTHETPERWLRRAIESVQAQLYPHWELCVADDGSTAPHVRRVLEEYRSRDPRIKIVYRPRRGHISAASNSALELATGELVAFLDHDDELAGHALYMVAAEIAAHPTAEVIYSDEDKLTERGERVDPYFKPDWDPDLFLAQNLVTHLCVCRTARVREVGGFRTGFEGAQDWDLVMRIVERVASDDVRHIPHVLYHWRAVSGSTALAIGEKSYATGAQHRTLATHFARRRETVDILPVVGLCWRIRYPLPAEPPLVSVVIPTRDQPALLRRAIAGLRERTVYPRLEIVVVDNQSVDPAARAYLAELAAEPDVRVVHYDAPFNFAAMNNLGAEHARGEVLTLLNNDVEPITPGWLEEMVTQALRPDVGAVGAMLYYPDDTIQHAGVILGLGTSGIAAHAYSHRPRGHVGQIGRALLAQTLSAVTAACLVIRRDVFRAVGGFDEEQFAIAYNDVDLCLRLRAKGYRTVWTPYAELYHVESASRGYEDTPEKRERFEREVEHMRRRWADVLERDPAYNPNLSLAGESFGLAFPPRTGRPWLEPIERESAPPVRARAGGRR